jgi:hypothetical protein
MLRSNVHVFHPADFFGQEATHADRVMAAFARLSAGLSVARLQREPEAVGPRRARSALPHTSLRSD